MTIELQNVRPDFDSLVKAMQGKTKSAVAWKDTYPAGTGQHLLELVAGVGTLSQHSIESLFLETYLKTARRDTSIYTCTDMLGVRIARKLSPSITVQMIRPASASPQVIPRWTPFTVGNRSYVAVEPLVFEANQSVLNATLWAGVPRVVELLSDGSVFQEYIIGGSLPFGVSDQHIEIKVNKTAWKLTHKGLWNYKSADRVVYDTTNGAGQAVFLFGNDTYGTSPNNGDVISFTFLDTQGTATEAVAVNTTLVGPSGIDVYITSGQTGGASEKSSAFYRVMAPHIFNSGGKAVTTEHYRAWSMTYPGVVDAKVQPQRDLNPYDVRLMNVIYVTLLVDTTAGSMWSSEVEAPEGPTYTPVVDGGYLSPGTYSYRITTVNGVGESEAGPATTYALSNQGSLLLQWPHVEGAFSYRIYGRVSGIEYLMVEVTPDRNKDFVYYLDRGEVAPGTGAAPSVNTTRANWWEFVKYMEPIKHASTRLIQRQPLPTPVDVKIVLYVKPGTLDLNGTRVRAYNAIYDLFKPRTGSLGRLLALSDIVTAAKVPSTLDPRITDVDYVEVVLPVADVPVSDYGYVTLNSLAIALSYTGRTERY